MHILPTTEENFHRVKIQANEILENIVSLLYNVFIVLLRASSHGCCPPCMGIEGVVQMLR